MMVARVAVVTSRLQGKVNVVKVGKSVEVGKVAGQEARAHQTQSNLPSR